MFDTAQFFTPRRKPGRSKPGKKPTKTEQHLRAYLELLDTMSDQERALTALRAWMPPRELVPALLDSGLLQRDRVELTMAIYSTIHPGHTLSWEEIGRVLGLSGTITRLYGKQLIERGRAEMRDGKFCLRPAGYEHPIIRGRFPQIYNLLR